MSAPCTTKTAPVSYWISLAPQQPRLNINKVLIIIVMMDGVSGTEVRYNVSSSTVRVHVTESVSNHEVDFYYWPVLLRAGS